MTANLDKQVVADFGAEWQRFNHHDVDMDELERMYDSYFHIFPWQSLPENPMGLIWVVVVVAGLNL